MWSSAPAAPTVHRAAAEGIARVPRSRAHSRGCSQYQQLHCRLSGHCHREAPQGKCVRWELTRSGPQKGWCYSVFFGFPTVAPQRPVTEGRTWPESCPHLLSKSSGLGSVPSGFLTFEVHMLSLGLGFPTGCSPCGTSVRETTALPATTSGVRFLG